MADNKTPLYSLLSKSTFLSKIQHPDYTQWREVWEYNKEDFETTTLAFRTKAASLNKTNQEQGDRPNGRVNHVDGKPTNESGGNNNKKKNKKKNGKNTYQRLPKEIWDTMSHDEKRNTSPIKKRNARKITVMMLRPNSKVHRNNQRYLCSTTFHQIRSP